ncbi:MAG: hypothetical protein ACI9NN_002196 [Bacteroidia bacterium]|jgi:hypothetical protein
MDCAFGVVGGSILIRINQLIQRMEKIDLSFSNRIQKIYAL